MPCHIAVLRRTCLAASQSILKRNSEHPTGGSPGETIVYRKFHRQQASDLLLRRLSPRYSLPIVGGNQSAYPFLNPILHFGRIKNYRPTTLSIAFARTQTDCVGRSTSVSGHTMLSAKSHSATIILQASPSTTIRKDLKP
jgi:hypothetical protein